ncbi:MAG TPA: DUF4238 domain-containing protein [Flavobacteriales bacterium]|nr:DUF4238 domain-containing protein [Flavobacteriales bacterium]
MHGKGKWKVDNGSKNHHFVPVYHIKRFTDGDGMLWWYDKRYKRFCRTRAKRLAPGGVLYEPNGNTVYSGSARTTIVETAFAEMDDLSAKSFCQVATISDMVNGISTELYAYMHGHMVTQFFRAPTNNEFYAELLRVWKKYPDSFQASRIVPSADSDIDFVRKSSRMFLPLDLLQSLRSNSTESNVHRLYHTPDPILVLTDNPVVFLRPISIFRDLLGPALLAVSSNRLYTTDEPGYETGASRWRMIAYNTLSIEQAERWVFGSTLESVALAVQAWEEFRALSSLEVWKEALFRLK